jgi:AmmeMemoRadiSam system protein B
MGQMQEQLTGALATAGFLEDETFEQMREAKLQEFAASDVREPAHAGSGYPDDPSELAEVMGHWLGEVGETESALRAIAAPHVSPMGGYLSYRAAYGLLGDEYSDKTFVILGTSHYGQPEKFGLTRKSYVTPWGAARTDAGLVQELTSKAGAAVETEDYCHAVEHSIEFQVVYLQSIFGPDVKILPILCGPYATSIYQGGMPEHNEDVRRFLGTLGEIGAREGDKLMWVLGIDMAHRGRRYHEEFDAIADEGRILTVATRDQQRIARAAAGDAQGFWDLVRENQDDLNWCGSSPLYTFLKAMPGLTGKLERYEQWNIDPASVVSFAGMTFR